jgi:signal transduction histidine kinase
MFLSRLSFRMQIVLVFVLCLLLLGTGVILLNAYWISALERVQRQQAYQMAEEQGRRAVQAILDALEQGGQEATLQTLQNDAYLGKRLNAMLGNYLAAQVVNDRGETIMATVGGADIEISMETELDEEGKPKPADFHKIQIYVKQEHPEWKTVPLEIPIHRGNQLIGYLDFLVQESPIGRQIETTGQQIGRLLWSLVFAFVSVLALGIYLVMLLSRRQVHLLAENEKLGRMAYVGTLASGLAHEIRNPLNAISVNLSVAKEELDADDPQSPELLREAMGFMGREVERLNHSMTSFLAFARPEKIHAQTTDLRVVTEEILELLSPQIQGADVRVVVELPEQAEVQADFSGLRQVLYNVILNAIQAMAEKPVPAGEMQPERVLTIGGRRESAQWLLWVEDTGPGIPPGDEQRIFEAFHTTKAAGSGFGLSIARAIIDSHGGEILARRAPRGVVRIEITLPETQSRR